MASQRERIRFQILCEDKNHYYFCKAFLESALGKRSVQCQRVNIPLGEGSGEQKVREIFPKELQANRSRPETERNWLLVVIDADNKTLEERKSQLPVTSSDKVVRIIPKRNIESWFHWLDGNQIDEQISYKMQHTKAKPTNYGKKMHGYLQAQSCTAVPSSIQSACDEWQAVLPRFN